MPHNPHSIQLAAQKLDPLLDPYCQKMIAHMQEHKYSCIGEICAGMKKRIPSYTWADHDTRVRGYVRILRLTGYAHARKLPKSTIPIVVKTRYYSYTRRPGTTVYGITLHELRRVASVLPALIIPPHLSPTEGKFP